MLILTHDVSSCYTLLNMKNVQDRFFEKVRKTRKCWEWTALTVNGYGRFRIGNSLVSAHRYAYELSFGEIPAGLFVLHKCDNRSCVKPAHLFLGTLQANMQDAVAKGRHYNARKTHCTKGHSLADAYVIRHCRTCQAGYTARIKARTKNKK